MRHDIEWVLLGSGNGKLVAEQIVKSLNRQHKIFNYVDSMSLDEVFEILKNASLLVAADGGLMHVGRAARVPIIGLFAGEIHPRMRFGSDDPAHIIHAVSEVADIAPTIVASSINTLLEEEAKGLTVEYSAFIPECSE